LKFQAIAEKTAKDARGLLYFAAPGRNKIITITIIFTIYYWFLLIILDLSQLHRLRVNLTSYAYSVLGDYRSQF